MALLAVAALLQGTMVLVAALTGAAVLVLPGGGRRAAAMVAALVASGAAILTLVAAALDDDVTRHPVAAAGALALGLACVGGVAWVVGRRPHLLALLVLGALPFRVPVPVGEGSANLLVPLYVVIAGGCLAYVLRVRRDRRQAAAEPEWPPLVLLERVLAAVLVLYALQSLYSSDIPQATKNVAFFYVPFAVLFRLLAGIPWTERMLRTALALIAGLALAFAAVAFYEFATGHLLIPNPKVLAANEAKPYFRVNSLFFDPNIYGRFVALAMIVLATVLLWSRRTRTAAWSAALLAVLWAGLVLSLSQSSFATLLVGLAVVAALRWGPRRVAAAGAVVVIAGIAVVLASPGTFGLGKTSERALDRATAGRVRLTQAGLEMARDRPVWGFGSGSFADRYRERERVYSPLAAAESHTIPLTIAAEQGAIGLLAYLALLAAALRVVFSGLRGSPAGQAAPTAVARVAVAAAFSGLVVHTLGYAAFLEDPLAWTLLAIAAGMAGAGAAWSRSPATPS